MYLPSHLSSQNGDQRNSTSSPEGGVDTHGFSVLRGAANLIKDGVQQTAGVVHHAATSTVGVVQHAAVDVAGAVQQAANSTAGAMGITDSNYDTLSSTSEIAQLRLSSEPRLPEDGGFDLSVFDISSESTLALPPPALRNTSFGDGGFAGGFAGDAFAGVGDVASTALLGATTAVGDVSNVVTDAASSALEGATLAVGDATAVVGDAVNSLFNELVEEEVVDEDTLRRREQDRRLQDIMAKRREGRSSVPEIPNNAHSLEGEGGNDLDHEGQKGAKDKTTEAEQSAANTLSARASSDERHGNRPVRRARSATPKRCTSETVARTRTTRSRSATAHRCKSAITSCTNGTRSRSRTTQHGKQDQGAEERRSKRGEVSKSARSRNTSPGPAGTKAASEISRTRSTTNPKLECNGTKIRRSRSNTPKRSRSEVTSCTNGTRSRSATTTRHSRHAERRSRRGERTAIAGSKSNSPKLEQSKEGPQIKRSRSTTPKVEVADGTTTRRSRSNSNTNRSSNSPKLEQSKEAPQIRRSRSTTPEVEVVNGTTTRRSRSRSNTNRSRPRASENRRSRSATHKQEQSERAHQTRRPRSRSPSKKDSKDRSRSRSPQRTSSRTPSESPSRESTDVRNVAKASTQKDLQQAASARSTVEGEVQPNTCPDGRKGEAGPMPPAGDIIQRGMSDLLDDSLEDQDAAERPSNEAAIARFHEAKQRPTAKDSLQRGLSGPIKSSGDRFVSRGMSDLLDDSFKEDDADPCVIVLVL